MVKGVKTKGCFFSALLTSVFYISNPFGVKGKVLGIDTRKILRPDPGHRTHYYPSYDIFSVNQILKKVHTQKILNIRLLPTTENDITQVIMSPMTWVRSQNFPCVNP